jgi:hypothetical protein
LLPFPSRKGWHVARSDASLPLIHRRAWKGYSANIVQTAFQNFEEMAEGSLAYREGMREARPWGIMCAMEKR